MIKLISAKVDLEGLLNHGRVLEKRDRMFDVNVDKAFRKLSDFQFDNPYDAFRELIANAIDSYVGTNREPKVEVSNECIDEEKEIYEFRIKDYGMGFNDQRILMLRTLGLSEKREDTENNIGRFGIGFATLFNPVIGVEEIRIDTNNEGKHEQLLFEPVKGKNVVPSFKRYGLDDTIDYGSEIVIRYIDKKNSRKVEESVKKTLKFLPFEETYFNGEKVKRTSVKKRNTKLTRVFWYHGWFDGHLTLDKSGRKGDVHLLNKDIYVESIEMDEILENLPTHPRNLSGVVNCKKLNLVLSRNEAVRDGEYNGIISYVVSAARELQEKIIENYLRDGDEGLRIELIKMLGRERFSREPYKFEEIIKRNFQDSITIYLGDLNKLLRVPLFTVFDSEEKLSLADISQRQIRMGYGLNGNPHIVCARDDKCIEEARIGGYKGLIVKIEPRVVYYEKVKNNKGELHYGTGNHIFDLVVAATVNPMCPFDLSGDIGKESLLAMCNYHLCDFDKVFYSYSLVQRDKLSSNQGAFLDGLDDLMRKKRVINLVTKDNKFKNVGIYIGEFSGYQKDNTVACYNIKENRIVVNKDHEVVQVYTSSLDPRKSAFYFVPTLAHEIAHQKIHGHGREFHIERERFERSLKFAIAQDS